MKIRTFRLWTVAAASVGLMAPQLAIAAPADQPLIADIALAEGGVLSGQVVDAQGAALAEAPVAVFAEGREVVRVAAAQDGTFAIGGLKGGVYEVATPGQHAVYRLWSARTAPPAAGDGVMLVSGAEVVRGQYGFAPPPPPGPPAGPGPFTRAMGWVAQHPYITAGVIATAVAVPVAISASDDAS